MGWEERKGRRYYYEKERVGGRVVSRYIGTGSFAQACAVLNASAKRKRERERAALSEEREALNEEARQVRDVIEQIRMLTHAALLAGGHHTHRGQWRKQREPGQT